MIRKLFPTRFGGYRANRAITPLLLSERQFTRELARERKRADRREIPFCLIDISMAPESCSRRNILRLSRALTKRLRITDSVGHRGPVTLGVILADTEQAGGKIVLEDIERMTQEMGLRCELELFVYSPDSWNEEPPFDGSIDYDPPESKPPISPTPSRSRALAKRLVDIVGSSIGILISAVPVAIACVVIRCTTPGPAIFRQVREGFHGEPFTIYKLRTMYNDAEHWQDELRQRSERGGPAFKIRRDPRITRVGRFLRATCIDELPQFVNVFLGQMSIVGPRPLPLKESRAVEPWQRRRLDVKPGITGIWQTRKHRGVTFEDWMRMDLHYVDHGSMWLDMKLIAKTFLVPATARGNL